MERLETKADEQIQISIEEIRAFLDNRLNSLERKLLLSAIKPLSEAEQKKTLERYSRMWEDELLENLFILSITSTVQESVTEIEKTLEKAPGIISKAVKNHAEEHQKNDQISSVQQLMKDINNA